MAFWTNQFFKLRRKDCDSVIETAFTFRKLMIGTLMDVVQPVPKVNVWIQ